MAEDMEPVSMEEAQEIHDLARASDPSHDQSSCFCCCMDCDFTPEDVY